MTTATARNYSPEQAYECFVGSISVQEFLAYFDTIEEAIDALIEEGNFENAPANLKSLLLDYCEAELNY